MIAFSEIFAIFKIMHKQVGRSEAERDAYNKRREEEDAS